MKNNGNHLTIAGNRMRNLLIFAIFLFCSCGINKHKQIQEYYFGDNKLGLNTIHKFNGKIVFTIETIKQLNSVKEISNISDSANISGLNDSYLCVSISRVFFKDGKYFFNFYPSKKALYGEIKKLRTFEYLNVFQVLNYLKDNNNGIIVNKKSDGIINIQVNLKLNNKMNCDFVNLQIDENKNGLRVQKIDYLARSFNNDVIVKTQIAIQDMHINNSCKENFSFLDKFYIEIDGNLVLQDTMQDYKLILVR